jgi:uncharacterized membrane protein
MKHSSTVRSWVWVLVLVLFSIPALSPLVNPAPTRSADGLLHLYRLVQLDALWQNGIFFSRWLPDLAYGYGLPLFNYYAPLSYYLTTPLHSLGIAFSSALNLSLALALLLGAIGMYFFAYAVLQMFSGGETRSPRQASTLSPNSVTLSALVAALAFLYSPYILFNALHRGNLPNSGRSRSLRSRSGGS